VREDLARYQAAKPCTACHGTRLRREARHVFLQPAPLESTGAPPVPGKPIFEVEHATLAECLPPPATH
jgi:excinuclease ABC subunit A